MSIGLTKDPGSPEGHLLHSIPPRLQAAIVRDVKSVVQVEMKCVQA
jgi:hypothetical protein